MNEFRDDFDERNAAAVKQWPDWKRQYDLRVESYTSIPESSPEGGGEAAPPLPGSGDADV